MTKEIEEKKKTEEKLRIEAESFQTQFATIEDQVNEKRLEFDRLMNMVPSH